ncbi:MAG: hypothetical protein HKP61_18280 [Dactylosporangium sp.]|nr:hypothetical protein [Dactylosporangium sp.]NNJ62844.1 hypothetical protein [Dactylosporangium sp.]
MADAPSSRSWHLRRWLIVALVVGYVVHVVWRLWLLRGMITPAAHADEDGYLLAARALAGGAGGYSTENTLFRRVGYPMMLAPIYWFTSDAFQVYRVTQVLNAVINAALYPLAYLFARRVFALPRSWALGGAFAVTAMPAVAFYSQFAMADAILATLGMAWLLLIHSTLAASTRATQLLTAAGAGALAGLIYIVHIRGIMVALAHVLVAGAFLALRRISWRRAGALVGTMVLVACLDPILKYSLHDKIMVEGNDPGGKAISAVTTLHGLALTAVRLLGQLWYLAIGTWGLGVVGLAALLVALWPLRPARDLWQRLREPVAGTRLLLMLTALVSTILVGFASSASLPTWDHRINYYAYPRYIHFLFPVWVLAGLTALLGASARQVRLLAIAAGVLTAGSAAVTYAGIHRSTAYRFLPFDSPETSFLAWDWGAIQVAVPTVLGVLLLAIMLWGLPRRRVAVAVLAGVTLLNLAVVTRSHDTIVTPMVVDQYCCGTPRLERDAGLGPGDTVAVSTDTGWYVRYNHMREVWWSRVILFDSDSEPAPDEANVVVVPHASPTPESDWAPEPGFELVVVDDHHYWAVWRRS